MSGRSGRLVKTCFRCDWHAETNETACPTCGVPLYVVVARAYARAATPTPATHDEQARTATGVEPIVSTSLDAARPDPPRTPSESLASTNLTARSIGALVLIAVVGALVFGRWLSSDQEGQSRAGAVDAAEPTSSAPHLLTPNAPPALPLVVGGVPFTIDVPTGATGWERTDFSLNKSIEGPQDAEAIIFWTRFPEGEYVVPCDRVLDPQVGPSAEALANAVAGAPGIELVAGPEDVMVDGRTGKQVVLKVRENAGCHPGFFFTWPHDECLGACWLEIRTATTIHVWIVEVSGTRIVVEAAMARQATGTLGREIRRIVGSIEFDTVA